MSEDTNFSTVSYNNSQVPPGDTAKHIQELALVALLSVVSVVTVIGNTLVILAVLTTRRLRTVTNCFVMSLAIADFFVGIFVLPPAVAYHLMGKYLSNNVLDTMLIPEIK